MKLKCTALGSYVMTAKPSRVVTTILEYWNSRTFKDLLHQIPKLSRPYSIFKDFPGPKKMEKNFKDFQELSRPCGHPVLYGWPLTTWLENGLQKHKPFVVQWQE